MTPPNPDPTTPYPNRAPALDVRLEDRNVTEIVRRTPPRRLKERLPVAAKVTETVASTRAAIRDVIHARDRRRLIVVVGPCSIHDPAAALEYAGRLADVAARLRNELVIVMRTYFEKPRTTVGWKGLVNDPHLDGSFDVEAGLSLARGLLLEIGRLGVPCASEMLDPITPQYVADCLAWSAIGARTTESQTHREMASGLSMPVGFKNGTDGNVRIAVDAIRAASQPHHFLSVTKSGHSAIVSTGGNPDCHVILRGGKQPNYGPADVDAACQLLQAAGLRPQVMIDVSHANSLKQHQRQVAVEAEVAQQIAAGEARIMGVMIESHLHEGRQDIVPGQPLRHGVSVTDACIGWAQTVPVLRGLAEAVRTRRAR
jgi:3-deoxy-7-phosphoheptulonate synthase